MSGRSLLVIEEFLRSSEQQHRKNALTALAVLGTEKSIEELARVSYADPDPAVRERALQELSSLSASALRSALAVLMAALDDAAAGQKAFAVLCHLHDTGVAVGRLPVSLAGRIGLSWSALRSWRGFGGRAPAAAGYALLGALVGTGLLIALLVALDAIGAEGIGELFAAAVMLAPLMGPLAAARSAPATTYPAQGSGALVEAAAAFLGTLPLAVIGAVGGSDLGTSGLDSLLLVAMPMVIAATVRAGTFMACGIAPMPTVLRWMMPLLTGSAAGMLAATAMMLLGSGELRREGSTLWITYAAVSMGIAAVFTRIDHPHSHRVRVARARGAASVAIVAALVLAVGAVVLWPSLPRAQVAQPIVANADQRVDKSIQTQSLPFRRRVILKQGQLAEIFVAEEMEYRYAYGDFVLTLRSGRPGARGVTVDDPPCLFGSLTAGEYEVLVSRSGADPERLTEVFPRLLSRIAPTTDRLDRAVHVHLALQPVAESLDEPSPSPIHETCTPIKQQAVGSF